MLNFVQTYWAEAEALAEKGRRAEALARVRSLLARPDLPRSLAASAHRLAATILVEFERYSSAKRHLRVIEALGLADARTHFLFGLAYEGDPFAEDRRAACRFRQAYRMEPSNPEYGASFGRAAIRCGRVKTGVRALRAASAARGENLSVLRVVVDGLIDAGQVRIARQILLESRFSCPRNAEVNALWERVRFATARLGQREARRKQDAQFATDGDVVLLPLLRLSRGRMGRTAATGTVVRRDVLSMPRPHLTRFRATRADR